MATVSRNDVHRAVEQLPDDRLLAAVELLEALALHDRRVGRWRRLLSSVEVSEIATSLRQEHAADDWITDAAVAAWLDSTGGDGEPTAVRDESQ
jgi:hypothetical protein